MSSQPGANGLKLTDRINRGDWAILQMVVAGAAFASTPLAIA